MLVCALMAICFVVQRLSGKKINPIVLAWHIQQWLTHVKKNYKPAKSSDTASHAEDGSVRSAPNSGKGFKDSGGSGSGGSAKRKAPSSGKSGGGSGSGSKASKRSKVRSGAISPALLTRFHLEVAAANQSSLVLLAVCLFVCLFLVWCRRRLRTAARRST